MDKITIKTSNLKANMLNRISKKNKVEEVGNPDFDWSLYDNGWNGRSLKVNPNIKKNDRVASEKVYCFESYVEDEYKKFNSVRPSLAKDQPGVVFINDIKKIDDTNVLAKVNDGANDIIINLEKESKYLNLLSQETGSELGIDEFMSIIQDPKAKKSLLKMKIPVEISKKNEKASMWSGYAKNLEVDLKKDIVENANAYYAKILYTNNGGFVVEVAGAVKAFMPTSMAASNKITMPEEMIGKTLEVMVESYNPKYGFIVSRKKYLKRIQPMKIAELEKRWEENPDLLLTGRITGSTRFGVFVELDEYLTGMIHKTLTSDELRETMLKNAIVPGTEIQVYLHEIDGDRIILSDVPRVERDAVIALREKEEEKKTSKKDEPIKKEQTEEKIEEEA